MSEEIEQLIQCLKTCSTAFLNVEQVETSLLESEASVIQKIMEQIKGIMKFIDEKIIIFDNEYYNGNHWQGKQKFYEEKAIEICNINKDYYKTKFAWIHTGHLIILTRSMKFIKFERTGYSSQYTNSPQEIKYVNERELTIEEVVKCCSFETIIKSIKKAIDKAITQNENKLPILKKRLELISLIISKL